MQVQPYLFFDGCCERWRTGADADDHDLFQLTLRHGGRPLRRRLDDYR